MSARESMTTREYWRSLEARAGSEESRRWVEREFPEGASELPEAEDGVTRRKFLGLLGASVSLAGAAGTGCIRKPVEKILPHTDRPEFLVPGRPVSYATCAYIGGHVEGLLVTSSDGRPTKVEGNPDHPMNLGAASLWAQAEALSIYDPDRGRHPLSGGKPATTTAFTDMIRAHMGAWRGGDAGFALLVDDKPSPTRNHLLDEIAAAYPGAKIYRHDPARPDAGREAMELAGVAGHQVSYRFDQADVVLAVDFDFLATEGDVVRNARLFSDRRRLDGGHDMNRLYVVEPNFSVTGSQADNRLRLSGAKCAAFLSRVAEKLGVGGTLGESLEDRAKTFADAVAADLAARRGRSLVAAGPRQPAAVRALALLINEALGNMGGAVTLSADGPPNAGSITDLAADLSAGKVKTLVILGSNPVYDAPGDVKFADALKKAELSIHHSLYVDETSKLCTWHVPASHFLEAWGDLIASDGTLAIQQPLIAPLFESLSDLDLLATIAWGASPGGYTLVRNRASQNGGALDGHWRKWLHDGVARLGAPAPVPALDRARVVAALPRVESEGLELDFVYDNKVFDGRYANNGWLQELPHPMTKLAWDNAALVSEATAGRIGVASGDVIEISANGGLVSIAAFVMPGIADDAIVLPLGYGRAGLGLVAEGAGFSVNALRTARAPFIVTGASARPIGATYELCNLQEHGSMEGRPLLREGTLEEFVKEPHFAREMVEHPPLTALWDDPVDYGKGQQWGMSIDLTACTGCNACVVACQAENNIPIVGKERAGYGREMHWLRIDRYFSGSTDNPSASLMPVPCMQCENAPCESVCPVAATAHSPDGLNDMAYNRCIGTRYCSNNCPYKVRHFNYFAYNKEPYNKNPDDPELSKMQRNQNVTVRFRGVMEKCTYCVQRISVARIDAKAHGDGVVPDGAIVPACAQTCPTNAIVFGDINDKTSRVAKKKALPREYAMLAEINTRPRTTYLAKIRNPNPALG